jgi:hypothetical protein
MINEVDNIAGVVKSPLLCDRNGFFSLKDCPKGADVGQQDKSNAQSPE